MSEVEKLYELAGVEPYRFCNNCVDDNGNRITNSKNCPSRSVCCNTCDKPYYEFTAEKQIKLIKWLAETGDVCRIDATVKNKWFVENEVGYSKCFAKFEEALANVINTIWEYIPEEEKQQVKGILEVR